MKKKSLLFLAYGVIFLVGTVLACIFSKEKNSLFWISYGFWVAGLLAACAVSLQFISSDGKNFPSHFSLLFIVHLYWLISLVASFVTGFTGIRPLYAIGMHLLLIGVFAILYIALLMGKRHITEVENVRQRNRRSLKIQLSDLEQCRSSLRQRMPDISPDISATLDTLIDRVKFSYPVTVDEAKELDTQISVSIEGLKSIMESATNAEEAAPIMKRRIEELLTMVDNRNMRIRHLKE